MRFTKGQWPDNICSGYIYYSKASNYEGFSLRDASHGIPTFGSVTEKGTNVFNYPGQTEEVAKRLVACWNAMVGKSLEEIEALISKD